MNGALGMLLRVLAQRYYYLNGGFFMVLFLLLFGVIDPAASIRLHLDLMILMGPKPAVLAGAQALLTLYFLKCLRFALQQPGLPENAMLYELQALPRGRLRRCLATTFICLYAPALAYAACVVVVSLRHGAPFVAAAMLVSQAGLLLLAVRSLERRFLDRLRPPRFGRLRRALDRLRPDYLRFGQYFSAYLLSQRRVMLLLLKGGSLLLLQLMVYINRDEPEWAGTYYLLLFLILGHGLIPWQLRQFSESLPWLRNLPIPLARRFCAFAGTYALLFVPELLFLLLHVRTALGFGDILSLYVLSATMLSGLHAVLYLPGMNMDRYLLALMLLYPLSIIALAIVSPWALALFWICTAMALFRLRFHAYEGGGRLNA